LADVCPLVFIRHAEPRFCNKYLKTGFNLYPKLVRERLCASFDFSNVMEDDWCRYAADLFGRVAKPALGSSVESTDDAFRRDRNNCVVCRVKDCALKFAHFAQFRFQLT